MPNLRPASRPYSKDFVDNLLGYHIRRLSVAVMSDLSIALAPLTLTPAEATTLVIVATQPGATQSEVGRALGIQRANMAPLIGGLIRRGLIVRERVDGRSQALHLTPPGKALTTEAQRTIRHHETRLFGTMSAAAQERMLGQLRDLWQRVRSEDGE
jgi:DNA-binding MarR family transcriptional regulator